jgi:5-oxoprolinase (ATP-hydrolysing) subunit A
MIAAVDLNSDMGESFGPYTLGQDEALLEWVSSANIACGFHAGDPRIMGETVALAQEKGVAVGAHPSFPDLVGFGRRDMVMTPDEVSTDLLYQLGALDAFCRTAGTPLRHVKPHGALYNRIAVDGGLARAVAQTVALFRRDLILVGLPGSAIERAAGAAGVAFAREVFADRAYNADGSLVSRRVAGAIISDPTQVARRAVRMILRGKVATIAGGEIDLHADTICIHGDTPGAVELARTVRSALEANGIAVLPLGDVLELKAKSGRPGRAGIDGQQIPPPLDGK